MADIKKEVVDKPPHYLKYEIEPITFIMRNKLDFPTGNVIKYVMRWRDKNGVQDLQKAKRYIDMMIELETTGQIDKVKKWQLHYESSLKIRFRLNNLEIIKKKLNALNINLRILSPRKFCLSGLSYMSGDSECM